jgi:hypothetical protein
MRVPNDQPAYRNRALNASDDSTAENACFGDWFGSYRRDGAVSAPPPVRVDTPD